MERFSAVVNLWYISKDFVEGGKGKEIGVNRREVLKGVGGVGMAGVSAYFVNACTGVTAVTSSDNSSVDVEQLILREENMEHIMSQGVKSLTYLR